MLFRRDGNAMAAPQFLRALSIMCADAGTLTGAIVCHSAAEVHGTGRDVSGYEWIRLGVQWRSTGVALKFSTGRADSRALGLAWTGLVCARAHVKSSRRTNSYSEDIPPN